MENCFNSYPVVQGITAINLYSQQVFKQVGANIKSQVSSLKSENKKEKFREKCKNLADYLINSKHPNGYIQEYIWKGSLRTWYSKNFTGITQHGGCFMIFNNEEKKLLELIYDAYDFCEKKKQYMQILSKYKKNNSSIYDCNSDENCINKCAEYNIWIKDREDHFNNKKSLLHSKCKNKISLSKFSTKNCDIMKSQTFQKVSKCSVSNTRISAHITPEEINEVSEESLRENKAQEPSKSLKQSLSQEENSPNVQTSHSEKLHHEEVLKHSANQHATKENEVTAPSQIEPSNPTTDIKSPRLQNEEATILQSPNPENSGALPNSKIISPPTYASSFSSLSTSHSSFSTALGMIKKKKKIRRGHSKFLRLLVPSFSNNKSELLIDDHLEHLIYDEEELIKKIKINELTKNLNSSSRKKDRSKTIIEIHMEILEECGNEEWKNKKEEFLEICIDEFTKMFYRTYLNLTDDDQITQIIKINNDIKKQNILWNKWIDSHRYISEKLKKVDWFNNLKNEWKKEKAYIKEMEELKKKSSNDNHRVPFLEIEKDLWKQWISEKSTFIEQYLEQDCLKELAEMLQNMSKDSINEETINYASLINIEELPHKKNYEELYKYIKKKLLTKLCILVLMTIIEECKKEVDFENSESYLDSSINEMKAEEYSDKRQKITEKIIEYNCNDLEKIRNKEIHAYTEEDNFMNQIEHWIREDDTHVNSIDNDGKVKKSDDIEENHIL
ncbi:STP1 protein [Plasmodium malariae]|uniref:STP1 protein n=1 Tax=Plasmodium malariae TaxID=5858 RepID=A0A1D3JM73_PLAMA|nr:STP1 protein [Plasmodium malariae]SBT87577.1 STP1 protein [Plasmodium malariae]